MCRPVACKECGKTTWAGCGEHVEDVKVQVPADQWCGGHDSTEKSATSSTDSSGGFFGRIFGGGK